VKVAKPERMDEPVGHSSQKNMPYWVKIDAFMSWSIRLMLRKYSNGFFSNEKQFAQYNYLF